jgi:hypothetical protein
VVMGGSRTKSSRSVVGSAQRTILITPNGSGRARKPGCLAVTANHFLACPLPLLALAAPRTSYAAEAALSVAAGLVIALLILLVLVVGLLLQSTTRRTG